jgi:hypothetical protein
MKAGKLAPGYIQCSTDNNEQEIHCDSSVTIRAPEMKLPTGECNMHEIRKCSERWEDTEVKAQFEAYTARVCSGGNSYRNRHCMLCNNLYVPTACAYGYCGTESLTMVLDWG